MVPKKGPEDCFQVVFRDFGKTPERLSKRSLQEGQIVQKIGSRLSKNNLETNNEGAAFGRYQKGAAAFGRRPLLALIIVSIV